MNTVTAVMTTVTRTRIKKRYLVAAGAAVVLALGIAAGVQVQQAVRQAAVARMADGMPQQAMMAQAGAMAPAGGMPVEFAPAPADGPYMVLVAGSSEQAQRVQSKLDSLRSRMGSLPPHKLLVAGTAEQEAELQKALEALRTQHGAGNVQVVDLRLPGAEQTQLPPGLN